MSKSLHSKSKALEVKPNLGNKYLDAKKCAETVACKNPAVSGKSRCIIHLEELRKYNQQRRRLIKMRVFDHYGRMCTCCKQSFIDAFLTLNHKNGNGGAHRREIKRRGGDRFYKWVVKHNFPKDLETNCWNCNCARQVNGGTCPHTCSKRSK